MSEREYKGISYIDFPSEYCVVYIELFNMEIGAIKYSSGQPIEQFQTFPNGRDAIKSLSDFLSDSILVGYDIAHGINFLYDYYMEYLDRPITNNFIDVYRIARRLCTDLSPLYLSSVMSHFNLTVENTNGAIDGCIAIELVYQILQKEALKKYDSLEDFAKTFKSIGKKQEVIPTSSENFENWKQELNSCMSIYEAFNFFDQHKFKKIQLIEFAKYLGVSVSKYSDKPEITRKIVDSTVGEKLKDDPIRKRNIAKYRKSTYDDYDEKESDEAILSQKFLHEKLRQLREQKYTQAEIAKILNVTTETVNKWEVGEQEPNSTNIRNLAAALEISIDDLFGTPDTIQNENETIPPSLESSQPIKFIPCKHCGKPTLEGKNTPEDLISEAK